MGLRHRAWKSRAVPQGQEGEGVNALPAEAGGAGWKGGSHTSREGHTEVDCNNQRDTAWTPLRTESQHGLPRSDCPVGCL